jgi:hypothetical protein
LPSSGRAEDSSVLRTCTSITCKTPSRVCTCTSTVKSINIMAQCILADNDMCTALASRDSILHCQDRNFALSCITCTRWALPPHQFFMIIYGAAGVMRQMSTCCVRSRCCFTDVLCLGEACRYRYRYILLYRLVLGETDQQLCSSRPASPLTCPSLPAAFPRFVVPASEAGCFQDSLPEGV